MDYKNKENMQKFYNEIAEKYDFIFPLSELQKKFMCEEINGNKILDIGAGTGKLAVFLNEKGYDITSIDINKKLIEKANKKGIEVINMNMLDIDKLGKFDIIINIGNVLPHLNNKEEVFIFLDKAYKRLEKNGKLIIQIINFNKFLLQKDENNYLGSLPLIKNENVKFERFYYLSEDKNIIFKTILDGKIENKETLLSIVQPDLKDYIEKIGFGNIKYYGGFDKSDFDYKNSMFVIITAEKK